MTRVGVVLQDAAGLPPEPASIQYMSLRDVVPAAGPSCPVTGSDAHGAEVRRLSMVVVDQQVLGLIHLLECLLGLPNLIGDAFGPGVVSRDVGP